MKYLEELSSGECFFFEGSRFILTTDFKKNNYRMCINLNDGFNRWIEPNAIVETIQIYTMDKDNIITPIKETKKETA